MHVRTIQKIFRVHTRSVNSVIIYSHSSRNIYCVIYTLTLHSVCGVTLNQVYCPPRTPWRMPFCSLMLTQVSIIGNEVVDVGLMSKARYAAACVVDLNLAFPSPSSADVYKHGYRDVHVCDRDERNERNMTSSSTD